MVLRFVEPYIIAEVGSNWKSIEDCEKSIKLAKICGASAVKFQMFDDVALYGYDCGKNIPGGLPVAWLDQLSSCCKDVAIDFMCTAFSPEMIDTVDPFVEMHKIASSDITDPAMLSKAQSKCKPILLSCGGSDFNKIKLAIDGNGMGWHGLGRNSDTVLLYCNSSYPSKHYNLFALDELRLFGMAVGFSDHSIDVSYPALSAVKHFGAIVIEKHFKHQEMDTPDAPHSLMPQEFKEMCDAIKYRWRGEPDYKEKLAPTIGEEHMRQRNHRRLIVTKFLPAGSILKIGENYGAYRSLHDSVGVSPMQWERFEGKTLCSALSAGDVLHLSYIGESP